MTWRKGGVKVRWQRMTWLRRCIDTNGTDQLIGDLAAVLEKYECHSPPLIQLLEHKMAVDEESKMSGLFNFLYGKGIDAARSLSGWI